MGNPSYEVNSRSDGHASALVEKSRTGSEALSVGSLAMIERVRLSFLIELIGSPSWIAEQSY
jgi:hypothetical protein